MQLSWNSYVRGGVMDERCWNKLPAMRMMAAMKLQFNANTMQLNEIFNISLNDARRF